MDNNVSQEMTVPVEGVAGGGTAYGFNDAEPLKQSTDPSEVPTADLVNVWCMPNTVNVGSQETPRALEPINLLAARNERESFQIAMRPKVSWAASSPSGIVQVQCSDLCSSAGDRLVVGQSLKLRRVVPVLGVPDALVPLDLPVSQLSLFPGETSVIWVSIDVPTGQPPGQYEGEIIISAMKTDGGGSSHLAKHEKDQLCVELNTCLDIMEPIEGKPMDEVVERIKCASSSLRRILFSPSFSEFISTNGSTDMMEEDVVSNLSLRIKLRLTVWEFIIPVTPSLPAVIGVSDTVIEDRFAVEHGSEDWYKKLDLHFKWLLQYRISPYFCKWGESMRVLTYTSPWPGTATSS
jgi:hypothetical protein